ncbi:hypothetical protein GCM10009611_26840 [Arthrobacter roseus]
MLEGTAVELYKFAVANPSWTKQDASDALGYTLKHIEVSIAGLERQRLLAPGTSGQWVAIAPETALADIVDEDERTMLQLRSRVSERRREFASIVPVFLEARAHAAGSGSVEVLEDPAKVRRLLIDSGRDVMTSVLIAQPGQGSTADVQEESVRKDLELLQRGIQRRNLYPTGTRDHVPTRKAVATVTDAGGEFRALPFVPLRLMIFDKNLAIVARQLDPGDKAALVIRDPNLVHIFTLLFDLAWEIASPFLDEVGRKSPLTSTQQSILNGLAVGYSDEVIARRLDISVRTCRRHIAWMLEELRADSRFQAGIKARDAGWI